jgi:hypothetical protein
MSEWASFYVIVGSSGAALTATYAPPFVRVDGFF